MCWVGVVTGVLAAVDSRGEWERGGGEVSWESSFTVRSGKWWAVQLYRSLGPSGWAGGDR